MNYMKQVAEMLGVELEEEFQIKEVAPGGVSENKYRITESGLECHFSRGWGVSTIINAWGKFFAGELAIVKKPWKPKLGEVYYTPVLNSPCESNYYIWGNRQLELAAYDRGLVFKTKDEAKEMTKKILDFVKEDFVQKISIDWLEADDWEVIEE